MTALIVLAVVAGKSIAKLEKVHIGGSNQWVLEKNRRCRQSVILFLHGGQVTSQLTLNRRNTKNLEKYFIVVNGTSKGRESHTTPSRCKM